MVRALLPDHAMEADSVIAAGTDLHGPLVVSDVAIQHLALHVEERRSGGWVRGARDGFLALRPDERGAADKKKQSAQAFHGRVSFYKPRFLFSGNCDPIRNWPDSGYSRPNHDGSLDVE